MGIPAVAVPLTDCLNNGLKDIVVPPKIVPLASTCEMLLRMCSRVPILENRGHTGVSTFPHVNRLDRLERTS